mmetsp:Transcript_41665/g.109890  ORF Transcript_41665/g.109890 Transcript_41665/m.109890 type:complete len:90 (+) Transcript_41665:648-917(+)
MASTKAASCIGAVHIGPATSTPLGTLLQQRHARMGCFAASPRATLGTGQISPHWVHRPTWLSDAYFEAGGLFDLASRSMTRNDDDGRSK